MDDLLKNTANTALLSATSITKTAGDVAKTTLDTAGGALSGASQILNKDDNFSLRPYNQVMLIYIIIILIGGLLGSKLFISFSLQQITGASLGLLLGMILCKFLWIIFGCQYIKNKEKEGYVDDE